MSPKLTVPCGVPPDLDIHVELLGLGHENLEPQSAAPGELIGGKYRIESQIAAGGMGVVYACTDVTLDRAAAVKVVHPNLARDKSIQERFDFEGRTLARLNNPHITRIFECGYTDGGQPFIAMELLEGIDLYDLLQREGTLQAQRVARLALQVCLGLRDAHALGIVHRDLKPENLVLTRDDSGVEQIKIIDFGISKQPRLTKERTLTQPCENMGSPHYMAPEQIRAPSDVDNRADIWSLGATMYELLTGRPPFEGESWQTVLAAVLTTPAPALGPSVPAALAAVVLRCLEREREARFDSVDDVARSLRAFLGGRPRERQSSLSRSAPPVAVEVTVQPSRVPRQRLSAWAAALAVLAVLAGGAEAMKLVTDGSFDHLASLVSTSKGHTDVSAAGVAQETAPAANAPVPVASVAPSAVASVGVTAPAPSALVKAPVRATAVRRRPKAPSTPTALKTDADASAGALSSARPYEPLPAGAAWSLTTREGSRSVE